MKIPCDCYSKSTKLILKIDISVDGYRVYALNSLAAMTDEQAADIVSFVAAGGGLIVGGQGWWWHSSHRQSSFANFPGNK